MTRAVMSKDGSVVIPKSVREAHGLKGGAEFEVIDGRGEIRFRPVDKAIDAEHKLKVQEFLASLPKYDGPPVELTSEVIREAIDKAAIEDWERLERQWNEDKNG